MSPNAIDDINSIAREMDAVTLLIGSAAGAATEVFAVELTGSEADSLRARAAAHAVTPEAEILLLVDAAIHGQKLNGWKP